MILHLVLISQETTDFRVQCIIYVLCQTLTPGLFYQILDEQSFVAGSNVIKFNNLTLYRYIFAKRDIKPEL